MPLFEFECSRCEHTFEELIRGDQIAACPTCGATDVRKLLSAPAVRSLGKSSLPIAAAGCPPSDAPPCGPGCCRLR